MVGYNFLPVWFKRFSGWAPGWLSWLNIWPDFHSGHGIKPHIGLSAEPGACMWSSLSLPLPHLHSISIFQKLKNRKTNNRLSEFWSVWCEDRLVLHGQATHKTHCRKMLCKVLGGQDWDSQKTYNRSLALLSCMMLYESSKHFNPEFPICQMEWMWIYVPWSLIVRL